MASPAMTTSRMLSMPVWLAASISSTSMSRPCAISTQASHSPHGSGVGPFDAVQRPRQDARRRRLAAASRAREDERMRDAAARDRVAQRARHRLLPDDVVEPLRPPFSGENLVGHQLRQEERGSESRTEDESDRGWAPPRPGAPAAHLRVYLALLPSGPDAVRRLKLHRVRAAVRPTRRRRLRLQQHSSVARAPTRQWNVADARRPESDRANAAMRPVSQPEQVTGYVRSRRAAEPPTVTPRLVSSSTATCSSSVCATWIEPGPTSSGAPHRVSSGTSVVYGNVASLEPRHGVHPHGRNVEHVLDRHEALHDVQALRAPAAPSPTMRNISSAEACGDTTFGATPPSMSPTV